MKSRVPMHFDEDVTAAQLAVLWRWNADTFEPMFGFPRQAPYPAALARGAFRGGGARGIRR